MLKCLIVLCVGTLLATVVESAPAPQQSTIDFLLDLNQDVLDKDEVQASVRPISQAQVGTTTEKNAGREPAPVFEDQADVQEIPRESTPTASQLNRNRDEVQDREEDGRSDSEDDSEQKDQQSDNKDDDRDSKELEQDSKDENEDKEDTTIRVYGPEDESDENDESFQQKEQKDQQERKAEPEVHHQPQEESSKPQGNSQQPQEVSHQPEVSRQPEVVISQHADTVKQFDEAVDHRGTDLLQEIDQVTIPEVISEQPDSLDDQQEIEVKPDQLFNHGSIVFDKSTFADEDLPSTTPFSNKKWNHDHGPPGFGPWHPKFPGGFPGHNHDDDDNNDGRPPFFGMPPFHGPPPRFDGPPHWHFHNHSHDHREWHRDHHDHDHGFHGHGFHRRGPWKWNRS